MELSEKIKAAQAELNGIDARQAAIEDKAIAEGRGLNAEEQAEYDRLAGEHKAKSDELAGLVKLNDARIDRANAANARKAAPQPRIAPDSSRSPLADDKAETVAETRSEGQWRLPATVRRHSCRNFAGDVNGMSAEQRAYRFGMFMLHAAAAQLPHRYRFESASSFVRDQFAGAHYSNDNNGSGFLVPTEFGTDLIDLRERYGVCRRLFKSRPMTSEVRKDPRRTGGLTAYFVGDDTAITESNKGWDEVTLTAKKLGAISRYSRTLEMDAVVSIGDDLAGEIAYAFANKEDLCGFTGTGTSSFGGISGVVTQLVGKLGLKTQGTGTTWGAIVLADFDAVVGKLPQYADTTNACWVMHRTFYYEIVEKLIQASGGVPAMEVRAGNRQARPIFKGYPVEFSQVMPSATAVTTVSALLGDFSLGASFGDRQGVEVEFSDSATIGGVSLWERDQVGVRGVERFDINVHDVGTAAVCGPIVGLTTST